MGISPDPFKVIQLKILPFADFLLIYSRFHARIWQ